MLNRPGSRRNNEGLAAFTLSSHIQRAAHQAHEKLKPHGVSLTTAADHYLKHVIAFENAPNIESITKKSIAQAESNNRRSRTVGQLKHRFETFASDFGEMKRADLTLNQVKEWVTETGPSIGRSRECDNKLGDLRLPFYGIARAR